MKLIKFLVALCAISGGVCLLLGAYDLMLAGFGYGKIGFFLLTVAVLLAVIAEVLTRERRAEVEIGQVDEADRGEM